jgi:hypothetical protein
MTCDYTLQFTDTQTSVLSLFIVVSTSRLLPTDVNTGTITVSLNYTLQISLHNSTHKFSSSPTDYQLSSKTCLAYNSSTQNTHKTPFLCCCAIVAFVSVATGTCFPSHCLETALVYLPISRSLQRNCSTHYNIETDQIVIECEIVIWIEPAQRRFQL